MAPGFTSRFLPGMKSPLTQSRAVSQNLRTLCLTNRVSPASVKAGAGCAAAEGSPLAEPVTAKLAGCKR